MQMVGRGSTQETVQDDGENSYVERSEESLH